jgi:hypothetical protein
VIMQLSPIMPTVPFQPTPITSVEYVEPGSRDADTVYLRLTISGTDIYDPACFIIGEGEAQLRWMAGDQQLRWLGYDANPRWEATLRLGTGQC